MEASITLAKAGGTTGEWAAALREIFGEYRAPTGVGGARAPRSSGLAEVAERSAALAGGPPRLLVAKPGLDGHSSGAEQIAIAARDAGMEVVYGGIRLTPRQIAESARDEDPDVIGLSILSGSHLALVPEVLRELNSLAVLAPVVVGGIIPDEDRDVLISAGVAAVYTPKDYAVSRIMDDIVQIVERHRASHSDN
jgi:(2R)-ethylmalonyl-CoA mutase